MIKSFDVLEAITSLLLISGWFFIFTRNKERIVKNIYKVKYYELFFLLFFSLGLTVSSVAFRIYDTWGYNWKKIILFMLFIETEPTASVARTFGYVLLVVCLTLIYGKLFLKEKKSST